MLKQLSIFAALVAFGTGPLHAREQEAVLQRIAVPGAEFDFVVAAPRPQARIVPDLGNIPDALIVHLHGGELALVFEDAGEMIKALDLLQSPVFASRVATKGGRSSQPVALYVVPKDRPTALRGEVARAQADAGPQ